MNITNLIGNTPLVKLKTFSSDGVEIFAKLESQNIGGSVKDRVALALIEDLEKKYPDLKNKTIIEPSSGNTGIGLAMICALKGYRVKIIMPKNATPERMKILKMFGAKIEFCSQEDWKGDTAIKKVKKLCQSDPRFVMPNQYENPACVQIHFETTAAEILRQCPKITHFVATMGTGGTITGIAKRLKDYGMGIQTIGVEIGPDSKIPGPRNLKTYVPPILDFNLIDKRVMIKDEDRVFEIQNKLARKEGLFVGPSSAAALSVATRIDSKNANVVVIFPDRGDKYLSII